MKPELQLHTALCNYIRLQYKDVIFFSDPSGVRLTIGQSKQQKKLRSGDKIPDLFIAEPKGQYAGLFIELKAKSVYQKNGELYKSEHLSGQNETLNKLMLKGYYACFGCGFSECKEIVEWYMKLK